MASNNKRDFIYDEIEAILLNTSLNFLKTYEPKKSKTYERPFVFLDIGDESEPITLVENLNMHESKISFGIYVGYEVDSDTGDLGLLAKESNRILELIEVAIQTNWTPKWFELPAYKMKLESISYSSFFRIDDKAAKGDGVLLGDVTYTRKWKV